MGLLPPRFWWPSYLLLIYRRLDIRTIHLHPTCLVRTWHHIESIDDLISFNSVAWRYDIFSRDPFMSQVGDGMTTGNASQVPPSAVTVLVIYVNCELVISVLHFKNTSASRRNITSVGPL
jgi:hypothetical protein